MSEEKLKNLAEKYPEYKDVFEDVFNWFREHPTKIDIRADFFYDTHSEQSVDFAFFLLETEEITETIYRVIDENGAKIGKDFNSISEIPETIDDVWGRSIETKQALIMPYYMRIKSPNYDL
ncbi:hypothetical protein TPENAI_20047 [Tenacibaculum litopenaei]|uniref:hypothetical protein n=1 Tax=Tenacibaculum litopenaei TaxID=396016 RepID=UPI00389559B8